MYETLRIPVQILLALMLVFTGCDREEYASVPVPLQQTPPYSYEGRIGRIWGGDNFEIVEDGKIHYAFIRGIDTPEPGQKFHEEANVMLRQLSRQNRTTIHVVDRDDWQREICDATIEDRVTQDVLDPAIELLNNGLAWYDQSDGPYSESFRGAEAKAKANSIGIWSEPNPVPPWEYWEQSMKHVRQSARNQKD